MRNNNSIIVLAAFLIIAFFTPFLKWDDFTMSGFDFVVSDLTPKLKYLLVVVPLIGLYLLVSSMLDSQIKHSKYILSIPLSAIVLTYLDLEINSSSRVLLGTNPFDISFLGTGLAIIASYLLIKTGSKKERKIIYPIQ
jgi:hypothetical protein